MWHVEEHVDLLSRAKSTTKRSHVFVFFEEIALYKIIDTVGLVYCVKLEVPHSL